MATYKVLNQFYEMMESSATFKLLNETQKAEIKKTYETATDEQVALAVETLKNGDEQISRVQAAAEENQKKQNEYDMEIKQDLKDIKKIDIQENDAKDRVESNKKAEELLVALKTVPAITTGEKPRKKFLGIF